MAFKARLTSPHLRKEKTNPFRAASGSTESAKVDGFLEQLSGLVSDLEEKPSFQHGPGRQLLDRLKDLKDKAGSVPSREVSHGDESLEGLIEAAFDLRYLRQK